MNTDLEKLAGIIFPNIKESIEDLENKYPRRIVEEGAEVTRFAPSPTGFLHTGALFTSLIDKRIASQTKGVFFLRIEDTDKKREVAGSVEKLIEEMNIFDLSSEEGMTLDGKEIGEYGPYKQSQREEIYKICAKELVLRGLAYPCFCTSDDLTKLREMQEKNKMIPGYYGTYARCRNYTVNEMIQKINAGEKYILRFRSKGSHMRKIKFTDSIRGTIEMAENDQDIVIIKSDGLPTYHFAHVVDDHFMRTTLVIRGEEWISSVALHLDLFSSIGFEPVKYAHVPTIMVNDGNSKRKLSKRKDKEAAVSFFMEEGYPVQSVLEYLLTVINSDYEPWRKKNPNASIWDFEVKLNKLNSAGALFDMAKLIDISKEIISKMNSEELYENLIEWSNTYDSELNKILRENEQYAKSILAIERDEAVKKRKDFAKYSDILPNISYFFEELLDKDIENGYNFDTKDDKISLSDISEILKEYLLIHNVDVSKDEWFENVKNIADKLKYCTNMKEYKLNPEAYKGSIADIAGIIRVAITNRQNTPDIYSIMKVLGNDKVIERIKKAIN